MDVESTTGSGARRDRNGAAIDESFLSSSDSAPVRMVDGQARTAWQVLQDHKGDLPQIWHDSLQGGVGSGLASDSSLEDRCAGWVPPHTKGPPRWILALGFCAKNLSDSQCRVTTSNGRVSIHNKSCTGESQCSVPEGVKNTVRKRGNTFAARLDDIVKLYERITTPNEDLRDLERAREIFDGLVKWSKKKLLSECRSVANSTLNIT